MRLLRLYGTSGSYAALYRSQPNVRTVIQFIAAQAASLDLELKERVPTADRFLPASNFQIDDDPIKQLLDFPSGPASSTTSGRLTPYQLWFSIFQDLGIYDTAYIRKVPVPGGIGALYRIPVTALTPERDPVTAVITGYRTALSRVISPEDLIVFPGYDPETNTDSVPPMETLRRNLAEEWAMGMYREWMWKNGARRDGIIKRPLEAEPMSSEALDAFLLDFAKSHSGIENSGKPAFLDEGMDWVESQFNAHETEYIGARKLNRAECAAAFGVPASLVGASDAPPTADERTMFYADRLAPFLVRVEQEIDIQLLPEFSVSNAQARRKYVQFNIDGKLRGSIEQLIPLLATAVGRPFLIPDEGRALLGAPPAPDGTGEGLTIPLNVLIGGQASPLSPVETPATPAGNLEPAGTTPSAGRGSAALPPPATKDAPAGALRRRLRAADEFETLFRKTFERQSRSILSVAGASKGAKASIDWDRYDRELHDDLLDLSQKVVDENGKRAARQIGGTYDGAAAKNYLDESSKWAAENVNRQTREEVAAAADDREALAAVFEKATTSRSSELGLGRATAMINFGRTEAAAQTATATPTGKATKTWVVTSAKSRHPEMDGETVPIEDTFSNGLAYPGDPGAGDAGEVAGCQCLVDVGVEQGAG